MRSRLAPVLLLLTLVAPLVVAPAASGGHPKKPHKAKLPPKPLYDALTKIDRTAGTVTITPKNGAYPTPRTFRIDEKTEVEVNGQRGTLADLRTGMKVTHGLNMDGTTLSRLVLSPAPPDPVAPAGR